MLCRGLLDTYVVLPYLKNLLMMFCEKNNYLNVDRVQNIKPNHFLHPFKCNPIDLKFAFKGV